MNWFWSQVKPVLVSVLGIALGLLAGSLVAAVAGENPLDILGILIKGAFGTRHDQGMVIYFATILIATGLAVAIPFQAGVFNIGAEGQTLMAALACALTALYLPSGLAFSVTIALCFFSAY